MLRRELRLSWRLSFLTRFATGLRSRLQPLRSPHWHPVALRLFLQGPPHPASCQPQSETQSGLIMQSCFLITSSSSWPHGCANPQSPPQKIKPERAPSPGNLPMSAYYPFLWEHRTSSVPVSLKALWLPVRTQSTWDSYCLYEQGLWFPTHRSTPSTWHKVGAFNWMSDYRWVTSEKWVQARGLVKCPGLDAELPNGRRPQNTPQPS